MQNFLAFFVNYVCSSRRLSSVFAPLSPRPFQPLYPSLPLSLPVLFSLSPASKHELLTNYRRIINELLTNYCYNHTVLLPYSYRTHTVLNPCSHTIPTQSPRNPSHSPSHPPHALLIHSRLFDIVTTAIFLLKNCFLCLCLLKGFTRRSAGLDGKSHLGACTQVSFNS